MRPTRDQWAMTVAAVTARRSTCLRRSVGCVLLNERGHVLATGYNGVAAGLAHCNDRQHVESSKPVVQYIYPHACRGHDALSGQQLDACQAIHAEQNALLQCHDVHTIHECFVTVSPCMTCTKLLLNTSCQRIVYAEPYAHDEPAKELWQRAGRSWEYGFNLASVPSA